MTETKKRTYSRYTKEATVLLAKHIKLCRKKRALSEQSVADRVGISRATLQKIEKGDPKCELGLYFETATIVGVKLFEVDSSFVANIQQLNETLALLPKSIRKKKTVVDDDF